MGIITPEEYYRQKPPPGTQLNRNHPLAAGLVGAWLMNEGSGLYTYDLSGFGNHGTLTNMDPATDWVAGPDGYALDFDGGDDYINTGAGFQGMSLPISIEAWMYRTGGGDYGGIVSLDKSANFAGVQIQIINITAIGIGYGDNTGTISTSRHSKASGAVLVNNKWYHVVGIFRGFEDMDIYVNGINVGGAYTGTGGAMAWAGGYAAIAAGWGSTGQFFGGIIGKISVYNRSLLPQEISQLYADPYAMWEVARRPIWKAPVVSEYKPQIMMLV